MRILTEGKWIDTAPIARLIIEGENNADQIEIALPKTYGTVDLAALEWMLAGVSEKETRVEQTLTKRQEQAGVILCWKITNEWTAVAGSLHLELSGRSASGETIIKLVGSPIEVRPAEGAFGLPRPDLSAQYLDTIRGLAGQARVDALAAQTSASQAAQSKTAAAGSVTQAAQAKAGAETAKDAAEKAKTASETAKTTAQTAATNAANAATGASNAKTAAETASKSAGSAKTAAEAAKAAAETASTNAKSALGLAQTASTAATQAKTAAETASTNAKGSATAAQTAATTATAAKGAAETASANAQNAANSANSAKTAAQTAQANAQNAATAAQSALSSANTAKTAAQTSATQARETVQTLTDAGLKILGYYATLSALTTAVPSPKLGSLYGVGTSADMYAYVWDGGKWLKGQLLSTAAVVTSVNGKAGVVTLSAADVKAAAASHSHAAAEISSGTLLVARGGTGAVTASAARTALGITPGNIGALGSTENAVSAAKLKTARTINGTAFDGTANITFGKVYPEGLPAACDLNTLIQSGYYYCPANATVAGLLNCPTKSAFFLQVGKHAGTYQRLTEYLTSGAKTYARNHYEGVWSAWHREYTTIDKPTLAELGAAATSHGTHVSYSTTAPVVDGVAAVGTAATVSRSDHRHPVDSSRAAANHNHTAAAVGARAANWTPSLLEVGGSNPNLLDNWSFANPINQRGATSFTSNGYTVDRWRMDTNVSVASLTIASGYLLFKPGTNGTAGNYVNFAQTLEKPSAGTYTLSFFVDDPSKINQIYCENSSSGGGTSFQILGNLVFSTITLGAGKSECKVGLQIKLGASVQLKIYAAKFELGAVQTLARKDAGGNWVLCDSPPNPQQELAKCQRYFYRAKIERYGRTGSVQKEDYTSAVCTLHTPVPLRIKPVVTVSNINSFGLESNAAVRLAGISCFGSQIGTEVPVILTFATTQARGFDRLRTFDGDESIDFDANF